MGVLYQKSIPGLIVFSVIFQLLALPLLAIAYPQKRFKA